VIQGDAIYSSIAAASVLAKTHRDEYMMKLHETHPQYGWNDNKGYGTPFHRRALKEHGESPFHRKTFKWNKEALAAEAELD
jgi:ribonuclease HII